MENVVISTKVEIDTLAVMLDVVEQGMTAAMKGDSATMAITRITTIGVAYLSRQLKGSKNVMPTATAA